MGSNGLGIVGRWTLFLGMLALVVFLPAGRLDWLAGWIWVALLGFGMVAVYAYIAKRSPGLAERRMRPGAGTPGWDRAIVGMLRILSLTVLIVAGLDAGRHGWSSVPDWTRPLGAAAMLAGIAGMGWAMGRNPHFEATVRIQREENHRVIDTGPYRIVRHPGYVAFTLIFLGTPLVLGSAWAFLPAGALVLLLVIRTALEDRYLRANLDGYEEYARRVRYRLLPGVW